MYYINRDGQGQRETVDEFASLKEARRMRDEYALGDPSADYRVSGRPCKGWETETTTNEGTKP
jgi:hypothetical protein